jgi:hypothetical protein
MERLRQSKTVCACMKKIMALCGSIRTGVQDLKKFADPVVSQSLSSAQLQIMNMGSTGISTRYYGVIGF